MCIVSVSGAIIIIIQIYSATCSNFNNLLAPKTLSITLEIIKSPLNEETDYSSDSSESSFSIDIVSNYAIKKF